MAAPTNAGEFIPQGDNYFLILKVTKRTYFNTIVLEQINRPDLHQVHKIGNIRTGRYIF